MRKREKIRYEIDPHNRLIHTKTGRKSKLPRFRTILDGRLELDKNNQFTYHVKATTPQGANIPHQVKLSGKWSLTDDHNLQLTLNKWGRQTLGDKLTLQSRILDLLLKGITKVYSSGLDVRKNALLFISPQRQKRIHNQPIFLNLPALGRPINTTGLPYRIKRGQGRDDFLTFKGGWELNKRH